MAVISNLRIFSPLGDTTGDTKFRLIAVHRDLLKFRKINRAPKQKLRQGDTPAAAVDDYPLLVKGHDPTYPL